MQTSWILPSWIQPFCTKLWLNLIQSDSNLFILTELDDGSHLEFCHLGLSHFAQKKTSLGYSDSTWWWHSSWILPIIDSATAILDTDTLLSSLRFTQKHSHSTLTLTQTNSIWLKLIHSLLTWWWQTSWILPSWILPSWILPSWIQPFCTKLWLKLNQSDSN